MLGPRGLVLPGPVMFSKCLLVPMDISWNYVDPTPLLIPFSCSALCPSRPPLLCSLSRDCFLIALLTRFCRGCFNPFLLHESQLQVWCKLQHSLSEMRKVLAAVRNECLRIMNVYYLLENVPPPPGVSKGDT